MIHRVEGFGKDNKAEIEISLELSRFFDDPVDDGRWHHSLAENEEELKSFLMKMKEESEKVCLKLNIQKTKIMTSGPITSWQIDGDRVADFIFLGSKITADGDCSHEIKDTYSLEGKLWPT